MLKNPSGKDFPIAVLMHLLLLNLYILAPVLTPPPPGPGPCMKLRKYPSNFFMNNNN